MTTEQMQLFLHCAPEDFILGLCLTEDRKSIKGEINPQSEMPLIIQVVDSILAFGSQEGKAIVVPDIRQIDLVYTELFMADVYRRLNPLLL